MHHRTTDIADRHTAIRVVIGLTLLQSGFSIVHAVTWSFGSGISWDDITQAYSSSRIALWLAAAIWSCVAFAAMMALHQGVRAGRWAYVGGAVMWMLTMLALAPLPLALSGTLLPLGASAVLLSPAAGRYLSDHAARQIASSLRGRVSLAMWVLAAAGYYAMYLARLTNTGWLAEMSPGVWRGWLTLTMLALPIVCTVCTHRGERLWHAGMFLVIEGLATFLVLLGYAPYARTGTLGAGYPYYLAPSVHSWWAMVPLIVGVCLLGMSSSPRRSQQRERWAI